jgi:serine/threonine protein kinase
MSSRGVAKLVDFGLAGDVAPDRASASETPQRALEYAALEKGTNAPTHDPRSDLFFLGGIYYELLTGLPPFPRTRSRDERRDFARYTNVRSLKSIDPNIPRAVVDACERMMKVAPEQRYQSPAAVAADLRQILAELDKSAVASVFAEPANGSLRDSQPRSRYSVMCIEHRLRQQNLLRDYLNKHGYRVLMFNDLKRGMTRLENDPPDCVLLMGESIGDDVAGAFLRTSELKNGKAPVSIAVLAERQTDIRKRLKETATNRVLSQPVSLRDLRKEIHLAIQRKRRKSSK